MSFVDGGFSNKEMPGAGALQRVVDRLRGTGDDNHAHAQRTETMALSQQHWVERESLKHKNSMEIMGLGPKSRLSSIAMGEHGPSVTWRDPTPRVAPPTAPAAKQPRTRKKPSQSQPPPGPAQGELF